MPPPPPPGGLPLGPGQLPGLALRGLPVPPPARPKLVQPAAPGEGVSGGLCSVQLPVPRAGLLRQPGTRVVPESLAIPSNAPGPMQSRLLLLGTPGGPGGPAARRVRLLLRQVVRGRPAGDGRRAEVRLLHAGAGAETGNPWTPLRAAASPSLLLRSVWETAV